MTSVKKTLGLIGFGQFGQLAAQHLAPLFDVLATDTATDGAARAEALGVRFGNLKDAASRDIVIVAVPVVAMPQIFEAIAPHLTPGALVIDVGSVKTLPSQWMVDLLPDYVDLVATHPLFGPQSAKTGLTGLRLVVCPIRGERSDKVAALGRSLGLTVTVTTPEEHDREMAYVQALTHLIGRSLVNLGIPDEQLKTPSYQHLLELCALIGGDTFELFSAIQTLNPYAAQVAESFVAQARSLLDRVAAEKA
jgi:prephenate dehydrogenase